MIKKQVRWKEQHFVYCSTSVSYTHLDVYKRQVLLTDRTEIDFDKKGNWLEVDCKKSAVPEALIPVPVKEYVKANFPREIITKIERGRTGVEIELGNDYSLKFNKKGKFVSMDD